MRRFSYLVVVSLVIGLFFIVMSDSDTHAQTNPISLAKPYYGTETITSYFDHRYPKYAIWPNTAYTNFVHYNGSDAPSCTPICYDGHSGIDFAMGYEKVLAAAEGIVTTAEWDVADCHGPPDAGYGCQYGLYINITHEDGYITEYGHLSSIAVEVGDSIHRGQIIGTSGNTGNSGGPHLHFGVYLNDIEVDPFGWSGAGVDPWEQYVLGATSEWLWDFTVWPDTPIPSPQYVSVKIIDDDDIDGFSVGCDAGNGFNSCIYWREENDIGFASDMWWTETIHASESDYWASWIPLIPAGFQDISVHVPSEHATSWQVDFKVQGNNGILHHTIIDQYGISNSMDGGEWLYLGTHYFGSNGGRVWVNDNTREPTSLGRVLGIDAVMFIQRRTWNTYLPVIISNP